MLLLALLQALAVQHPSWLPFHSDSVPHVTVSVAEGVAAREAGDLVRDARAGARAHITPLLGVKLLHGTRRGLFWGSWAEP